MNHLARNLMDDDADVPLPYCGAGSMWSHSSTTWWTLTYFLRQQPLCPECAAIAGFLVAGEDQ
jgi:hypothetical protein